MTKVKVEKSSLLAACKEIIVIPFNINDFKITFIFKCLVADHLQKITQKLDLVHYASVEFVPRPN